MPLPKLTIARIVILCTTLTVLNGIFLEFLVRQGGLSGHPFHPMYLAIRELMLLPGSFFLHGLFIAGSLWNAFLRPERPEWLKLGTVFVAVAYVYGLLLLFLFEL